MIRTTKKARIARSVVSSFDFSHLAVSPKIPLTPLIRTQNTATVLTKKNTAFAVKPACGHIPFPKMMFFYAIYIAFLNARRLINNILVII